MTESKHTPGPWMFAGAIGFGRAIDAASGEQIAVVYGPDTNHESDKNVALIAAAPEMLAVCLEADAALTHAIDLLSGDDAAEKEARRIFGPALVALAAVIAKAEGRS
ncbi:MAG: hypothetical protein ABT940_03095 [Alphaproteobacteria bacterium]